jgi:hypothetical protein
MLSARVYGEKGDRVPLIRVAEMGLAISDNPKKSPSTRGA